MTQVNHFKTDTSSVIINMICTGTMIGSPCFGFFVLLWIIQQQRLLMIFILITLLPKPEVQTMTILFLMLGVSTGIQTLGTIFLVS